jgi:hypothetical protein
MDQTYSQPGQQIQVKASDEALRGLYANLMQAAHTPEEFVLDFMYVMPPVGQLIARVIVSPAHAKRIAAALMDNVKKYEAQFGNIEPGLQPSHQVGFRTE